MNQLSSLTNDIYQTFDDCLETIIAIEASFFYVSKRFLKFYYKGLYTIN